MAKIMRPPEFWTRPSAIAPMLAPLSWAYSVATRLKQSFVSSTRVGVPVVCIGNLVAGGAGKTPVALAIADILKTLGFNVHFLSRGYGGKLAGPVEVNRAIHSAGDVGDEPLLLARVARTWVGRDRVRAAKAAIAAGAEIMVMDDGFQNPSLHKDISIVVVDGGYGFGNGRVMPAGPLRENVARGLRRADAAVIMHPDDTGAKDTVRACAAAISIFGARLTPATSAERFAGEPVVAFAGIGRPAKFFQTLENIGSKILHRQEFADHHPYADEDIMPLMEMAHDLKSKLVTTAKDFQRLPETARPMVDIVDVELEWRDAAAIESFLRSRLSA